MVNLRRLVVLISGNGSNLQAVMDACTSKYLNAKVCSVVSNRTNAYGLERAQKAGVPTCVMPFTKSMDRTEYDTELANTVGSLKPDLIVLAGWMHVLSSAFLNKFPKKVVNLHPALPDTFVGMHGIRQAYDAYQTDPSASAGVMTHYVIPEVDKGEYIQALRIPINSNDSYEDLETRVKKYEKEILVSSLKILTDDDSVESEQTISKDPMDVHGKIIKGKVRDVYDIGHNKLAIVHSDRLSSFDRHICDVSEKGRILAESSAFWFKKIENELKIKTHFDWLEQYVMVTEKCKVFPIEVVVRGFITGSTQTSLWTHYKKGVRDYCGVTFPDGLVKNQRLEEPVITPTTKGEVDELISAEEIVTRGLTTQAQWDEIADKAMRIFKFGQKYAKSRDLLLVDTKYEFGVDSDGNILLIDEVHTCDSSRFWFKSTYDAKFSIGEEPEKYDKDVVRDFVKKHYPDPYAVTEFDIPEDQINNTRNVYHAFFKKLTGEEIKWTGVGADEPVPFGPHNIIDHYFQDAHWKKTPTIVVLAGSPSDQKHIDKITKAVSEQGFHHITHISSAHKNTEEVLRIIKKYNTGKGKVIFVTVAGRSNALSGVTACNTHYPVFACPPFSDKDDMMVNINSTLQMPSKVPVMTVLEPGNVALAAKRIFALH